TARPRAKPVIVDPDKDVVVKDGTTKEKGKGIDVRPVVDRPVDDIVAKLPELTKDEQYEAALLRAIDQIADQKYDAALESLEEAQKLRDTGAVQREIYKVQAILSQREAAAKAVSDVKTVLEDGKPEEAAKLA